MASLRKTLIHRFINYWIPFFAAGIRVTRLDPDFRAIDVELRMHFWNRNYVGTHFGGSLYAMVDPFYMLMLLNILGREYIVWDKAASIRFKKPGQGTVRAEFRLDQAQIDRIRQAADADPKVEPTFLVQVKDASGEVVAEVEKLLYVKRKDKVKAPGTGIASAAKQSS